MTKKEGEGTQFNWTILNIMGLDYERIITPLEGELLLRDCRQRVLMLKQLYNNMKDFGRKSCCAFDDTLLADYDQLDG